MRQRLLRVVDDRWHVRVVVATATSLLNTVRRRLATSPVATASLGRVMVGSALLSAYLKPTARQRVQIHITGDGPLREVVAECNGIGHLRGYVRNPQVDLPPRDGKWDVARAVGRGYFTVLRDLGLGEPYASTVPLVSGEIAQDLAYYLLQSEQVRSAVLLGVLIRRERVVAAGGCLVERLPEADETAMDRLSERIRALGGISHWLWRHPDPADLVAWLLEGGRPQVLEVRPLRFRCRCRRSRALEVLMAMDRRALIDDLRQEATVEVRCGFCNAAYRFTREELDFYLRPLGRVH